MSCLYLPNLQLINFLNNEKINESELEYYQQYQYNNNSNEIINKLSQLNKFSLNPNFKIQETSREYQITALIPGYEKNEINIEVKNGRLVISAYREEKNNQLDNNNNNNNDNNSYNNNSNNNETITIKKYKKTIDISNKNLNIQSIKASYNNNTLNIIIQKLNDSLPISIKIE